MTIWEHSWNTWQAGGGLLLPLAVLSVVMIGMIVRSRQAQNRLLRQARELIDELEMSDTFLRADLGGWLASAYAAALRDIKGGAPPMSTLERVEQQGLEALRKDWLFIGALTAAAPLVGLLGTVTGMIHTFDAVADIAGDTGSQVADGISQALLTTQFGLVVALPGVFGLARLRAADRELEPLLATCRFLLVNTLEIPSAKTAGGLSSEREARRG